METKQPLRSQFFGLRTREETQLGNRHSPFRLGEQRGEALLASRRLSALHLTGATQAQPNSSDASSPIPGAAFRAAVSLLLKRSVESREKWDRWTKRVPVLPSPAQTRFSGRAAATCRLSIASASPLSAQRHSYCDFFKSTGKHKSCGAAVTPLAK